MDKKKNKDYIPLALVGAIFALFWPIITYIFSGIALAKSIKLLRKNNSESEKNTDIENNEYFNEKENAIRSFRLSLVSIIITTIVLIIRVLGGYL